MEYKCGTQSSDEEDDESFVSAISKYDSDSCVSAISHSDSEIDDEVNVKLSAIHMEIKDCLKSIVREYGKHLDSEHLGIEIEIMLVFMDYVLSLDIKPRHFIQVRELLHSLVQCRFIRALKPKSKQLVKYLIENADTGELKIYDCRYCKMKFVEQSKRDDHHTEHRKSDKPYECSHCQTFFKSKSDRQSHMGVHILDGFYKCCQCNETFRNGNDLLDHCKSYQN